MKFSEKKLFRFQVGHDFHLKEGAGGKTICRKLWCETPDFCWKLIVPNICCVCLILNYILQKAFITILFTLCQYTAESKSTKEMFQLFQMPDKQTTFYAKTVSFQLSLLLRDIGRFKETLL